MAPSIAQDLFAQKDPNYRKEQNNVDFETALKESGLLNLKQPLNLSKTRLVLVRLAASLQGSMPSENEFAMQAAAQHLEKQKMPSATKLVRLVFKEQQQKSSDPDPALPSIDINDHRLSYQTEQAVKAMVASNNPPFLFLFGDHLSRINRNSERRAVAEQLTDRQLRNELAKIINFCGPNNKPAYPPEVLCQNLLAERSLPFPRCSAIITTPIFASDGKLIIEPGYSETSRIYYDQPEQFRDLKVPAIPTQGEVDAAKDLLWGYLENFPFADKASKTNTFAMVLQPFARQLIHGVTPMYLLDKPEPGTGASLLAALHNIISTGYEAILTAPTSEEEWEKIVIAEVIAGRTNLTFDDVRDLEYKKLSAFLTAIMIRGRMLGHSRMIEGPNHFTWVATGNNAIIDGDKSRRLCRVRLDRQVANPSEIDTSKFRHDGEDQLKADALAERPLLVQSCLIIIQSWLAKGRQPYSGSRKKGGFTDWLRIMGGIVESIGLEDFEKTDEALKENSTPGEAALKQLIATWWKKYSKNELLAKNVYDLIRPSLASASIAVFDGMNSAINLYLGKHNSADLQLSYLGRYVLGINRERVFDIDLGNNHKVSLKLRSRTAGHVQWWFLEEIKH